MPSRRLFARKSIEDILATSEFTEHRLKRTLGPWSLGALGVGAIIGVGIYALMGITASEVTGPAIVYSFAIAAACCGLAILCYAELSTMLPVAGTAYTYAYATLGEFVAWILGWDLILEYSLGAAAIAVSASDMFVSLMNHMRFSVPPVLARSIFDDTTGPGSNQPGGINLPAVLIVAVLSCVLFVGIQESARVNNFMVFIKLAVIFIFIVWGIHFIDLRNYDHFLPANEGRFGFFGWSGVLRGAGILYFAYIGVDSVGAAAEEAKNPTRDIPLALLVTLGISTLLYVGFALVLTGVVSYLDLKKGPIGEVFSRLFPQGIALALSIGTLVGLASATFLMLFAQSRLLFSIARDGLLPPVFTVIHPKYQTPWAATLAAFIGAGTLAAFAPLRVIAEITSMGTLLTFTIVCASVLVLRHTEPNRLRPFRVPFSPFIPTLGIVVNLSLMIFLGSTNWLRLGGWLVLGIGLYFFYGSKRSRLANDEDRTIWRRG